MAPRLTCVACGKLAPDANASDTRAGAEFGWRLARRRTDDGTFVAEFRCPECWAAYVAAPRPGKGAR